MNKEEENNGIVVTTEIIKKLIKNSVKTVVITNKIEKTKGRENELFQTEHQLYAVIYDTDHYAELCRVYGLL